VQKGKKKVSSGVRAVGTPFSEYVYIQTKRRKKGTSGNVLLRGNTPQERITI
jgi:hypothetical protein